MKLRCYERYILIYSLIVVYFIFLLTFVIGTFSFRIYEYISINGIVLNDTLVEVVVDKDQKNSLYKNKYIFFEGEEVEFKIEEVVLDFFKSGGKYYDKIFISIKYNKELGLGDVIKFSVKNKKIWFIKIYEVIWKGE